jgi:hypothetical protein
MLAPEATYRQLMTGSWSSGWLTALKRPALVALILGTGIAISATRHVAVGLVISLTAWWSFAVIIQLLAAIVLITSARHRSVSIHRGIDLLFAGHAPWSLWLLIFALPSVSRSVMLETILMTAIVPFLWTGVILFAFCRQVLKDDRKHALRRTLVHQGFILVFIVTFVVLAIAAYPRLMATLGA